MSGYNGNGTVCLGMYNGSSRLHEIRDFYKVNIVPIQPGRSYEKCSLLECYNEFPLFTRTTLSAPPSTFFVIPSARLRTLNHSKSTVKTRQNYVSHLFFIFKKANN